MLKGVVLSSLGLAMAAQMMISISSPLSSGLNLPSLVAMYGTEGNLNRYERTLTQFRRRRGAQQDEGQSARPKVLVEGKKEDLPFGRNIWSSAVLREF